MGQWLTIYHSAGSVSKAIYAAGSAPNLELPNPDGGARTYL